MNKQWNIISRDFPLLEINPGIKIPVKMTRYPGNPGSQDRTPSVHHIYTVFNTEHSMGLRVSQPYN